MFPLRGAFLILQKEPGNLNGLMGSFFLDKSSKDKYLWYLFICMKLISSVYHGKKAVQSKKLLRGTGVWSICKQQLHSVDGRIFSSFLVCAELSFWFFRCAWRRCWCSCRWSRWWAVGMSRWQCCGVVGGVGGVLRVVGVCCCAATIRYRETINVACITRYLDLCNRGNFLISYTGRS